MFLCLRHSKCRRITTNAATAGARSVREVHGREFMLYLYSPRLGKQKVLEHGNRQMVGTASSGAPSCATALRARHEPEHHPAASEPAPTQFGWRGCYLKYLPHVRICARLTLSKLI